MPARAIAAVRDLAAARVFVVISVQVRQVQDDAVV